MICHQFLKASHFGWIRIIDCLPFFKDSDACTDSTMDSGSERRLEAANRNKESNQWVECGSDLLMIMNSGEDSKSNLTIIVKNVDFTVCAFLDFPSK